MLSVMCLSPRPPALVLVRALSRVLTEASFVEASSGTEALELLCTAGFDVALLDENFGSGPSGAEVTARVREWERERATEIGRAHV